MNPIPENEAWNLALNYCFSHHAKFGSEVVFNFGPFGFLYGKTYFPATYPLTLAVWTLISLLYALLLWRIASELCQRTFAKIFLLVSLICVAGFFVDTTFFDLNLLLIFFYFYFDRGKLTILPQESGAKREPAGRTWAAAGPLSNRRLVLLLAGTAGLIALVKFTFFISGLCCVAFITVDQLVLKRKPPDVFFAFASAMVLGWLAAGQPLAELPGYIFSSMQICRCYSESLALAGPQDLRIVASLACMSALIIAVALRACQRRLYAQLVTVVPALASLFFLIGKASYVRHDLCVGHGAIAPLTVSFAALIICAISLRHNWNAGAKRLAMGSTAVLLGVVQPLAYCRPLLAGTLFVYLVPVWGAYMNLSSFSASISGANPQAAEYDKRMEQVRAATPLPALPGTVDSYPVDLTCVIANHLKLNNRPIFQSYQADNRVLLEWNAQHLSGPGAPDWVIFRVCSSIDDRLPALDDSLSWLELLKRYTVDQQRGELAILRRRRGEDRALHLIPVGQLPGRLNEAVVLPPAHRNELIWAQVKLKPNILHRLLALFYKALPPQIELTLQSGVTKKFTAPIEILSTGFLLSPCLQTSSDFCRLYDKNWTAADLRGKAVVSLKLWDSFVPVSYSPDYEIRLYKLDF